MADRANPYEAAFADWMRGLRVTCLATDETHRTFAEGIPLKTPDFLLAPAAGRLLVVDVKGRRLGLGRRSLETWATADDLHGLHQWGQLFPGAIALLAFVYRLELPRDYSRFVDRFGHHGCHYGCLTVKLTDYRACSRVRSPRWRTVCLSVPDFTRLARPLSYWLLGADFAQPAVAQPALVEPAAGDPDEELPF